MCGKGALLIDTRKFSSMDVGSNLHSLYTLIGSEHWAVMGGADGYRSCTLAAIFSSKTVLD